MMCRRMSLADGALKSFLEKTKALNPEERGHALEEDEGISVVHEECATEGQTEVWGEDNVSVIPFCIIN